MITEFQEDYIRDLCEQTGFIPETEVCNMTKAEASVLIEDLLFFKDLQLEKGLDI